MFLLKITVKYFEITQIQDKLKRENQKDYIHCKNNCHIAHQLSILTTILATFQLRN